MTTATPTPLDIQWLRDQINTALASDGQPADAQPADAISLPRATVQLVACVLAAGHRPPQANRYKIANHDLRSQVIAELQRLASHGEAPSKTRWNEQRGSHLPTAAHCCRILGAAWPQLITEAGLRLNHYARRAAGLDDDPAAPPAAEPQPAILQAEDYVPLPVASSRTEVLTAGNVRITRTYHTIR